MNETTVIERPNELAVFDAVAATLAEYKAENAKLVFAYATPTGEKDARSQISKLRTVKAEVAKVHKEAKAEALAFGRRLDAKKNEYTGEIEEMIAVHKDPLDVIEADKQAVIDAEKKVLEEAEEKRLLELDARERAVLVAEYRIAREKAEAEEKIAREKAGAERKEREKRIAADAAETAKTQAEAKAKVIADTFELAEKNRIEAEAAKEQRRIENKKHRKKIEDEIHCGLVGIDGIDSYRADAIVAAIKENRIPNVSIQY